MNISYKWLKRFIDFDLSPSELAAAFTSVGLECDTIEEVESIRGGLRGVVIGKVLTCEDHPNSDHLHITTVDLGSEAPVQIVCGAPNVAAGQTVAVATVGCTLYSGDEEFKIKKSKIRGVESLGMICAADEIGVGTSHDGIMVLDDKAPAGMPAAEYFNVDSDYRLEVELTPNRVDGASHLGCARDLKAWMLQHQGRDEDVRRPDVAAFAPDRTDGAVKVEVEDTAGCPRYSGVTIRGVKVQESPEWLKSLLIAAGSRPINNVVDITNFILLGLGQPLHCFDVGKMAGERVVVRTCKAGTAFTTLDGVEHKLDEADLMICDAGKPMCMAGVYGGLGSGVTEQTTDVFIESAYFNPTRVRKTARRHGLNTDASFRYERGTDPCITVYAAKVAALMIKELAGGEICGDVEDICPQPVMPFHVELPLDYANSLMGKDIPAEEVKRILRSLEIEITSGSDGMLSLEVPRYRVDVTRPCDVVEEILRIYGYNNVEFDLEMRANLSQKGATDLHVQLQEEISEALSGCGYAEIMNNSLSSISYYEGNKALPEEGCVHLMNPLSRDLSVMRRTLLYGALESAAYNINRKTTDLKMYEFGNIYSRDPLKQSTPEAPLSPYSEQPTLGILLSGHQALPSWNTKGKEADFFDLKGVVEMLLTRMGVKMQSLIADQGADNMYRAYLDLKTRGGDLLCRIGIVGADELRRFGIEQPVFFAEVYCKQLYAMAARVDVKYSSLPKTMPVKRDLALLVRKDVDFGRIEEIVRKSAGKMLRSVSLFDVYEGKNLPAGTKSYAISLLLQDPEKTLQDKQIDAVMQKVTQNLQKQMGAQLR